MCNHDPSSMRDPEFELDGEYVTAFGTCEKCGRDMLAEYELVNVEEYA